MDIRETLDEIGESAALPAVAEGWETSMNEGPEDLSPLLDPKALAEAREFAGLPAELDTALAETAAAIGANAALYRLLRHAYHRAYFASEPCDFSKWPDLDGALGEKNRLFYLIVALASVPLTRQRHRKLRVARRITRDTCRDIALKVERSAILHPERPGLDPVELNWLRRHVHGEIFTLGRFQFGRYPYRGGAEVFRNDAENLVLAFAPPDLRYDSRGHRLGDDEPLPPGGWISRLTVGEGDIRGHPISPDGLARPREATIPAGPWRRVVSTGDPVLEIHVPASGEMTPDAALASLKEADRFFRRIFRGRLFRAFICHSWFLGPALPALLPPGSHLRQFREQGYLYPVPSTPRDGLRFIFGTDEPLSHPVPRDTALRKAVMEHLERGGPWGNGGLFYLPEELPLFGKRPYREHWKILEKRLEDL